MKVGLIGCGGISKAHAAGWRRAKEKGLAEVVATCDIEEERAKERAEELGAGEVFTDYRALLSDAGVDAVDICLPHYLHCEATVAAAEAGKHVLVEKPMARNLEEGRRMLEACARNGVILMVAQNMRFDPFVERAKQLIGSGAIGKVLLAEVVWEGAPGLRPFHRKKELIGGGTLISTGIHPIDYIRWLVGEVRRVSCFLGRAAGIVEGEDTAVLALEFENGAVGTLVCTWAAKPGRGQGFWIYGTEGALFFEGGKLTLKSPDGDGMTFKIRRDDSISREIEHFVKCVAEGRTPRSSGEEAFRSLQVAIAAYRSAETGMAVELPLEEA